MKVIEFFTLIHKSNIIKQLQLQKKQIYTTKFTTFIKTRKQLCGKKFQEISKLGQVIKKSKTIQSALYFEKKI